MSAADQGVRFADVDDALFDALQIPMTTRDIRSVGEMLVDVDQMARQLLMDLTDIDAGRLLRGWPVVVTAAAELWESLPTPTVDDKASAHSGARRDPIIKVVSVADAINTSLRNCRWPPPSQPDRRMTQMAKTLDQARTLVRRYGAEVPLEGSAAQRDLEGARARIMHTLFITAHAVGASLYEYGRARFDEASNNSRPLPLSPIHSPYAVPSTRGWIQRMSVCESAAGRYFGGRFTQALAGEAAEPVQDDNRIARALAGWDIQAHRTLASESWQPNMLLITRTQGMIAGAAQVLVDAAQSVGQLEISSRLAPAITESGRAWSNLARRWGDLVPPGTRLNPDLMRAAAEVRSACRELTHDTTTMASLDVIASRLGNGDTITATLHALESGAELADVIAEKGYAKDLTGQARALSIRANNDIESGLVMPPPDDDIVWVSPSDILARREVALPPPVRDLLRAASESTVAASSSAAAAATVAVARTDGQADAPAIVSTRTDRTRRVPTTHPSPPWSLAP